ncbi:MAG: WecB/TagA/CpsF family glycosyltransferase [Spirochaetes bacterium]|nr:WecB/TagA/CpsF family glycosyltransferase [Spirochaetota bacterium]
MKTGRINILGSPVDALTMKETVELIDEAIKNKRQIHHVAVNAAKIVNMKNDRELYDSVVNCDIINADGQAVVWAAKILGKTLPERVTGVDLMQNLVELAYQRKYKIFFLGAKEEVVSKVVDIYKEKYSRQIIAGYRNGYFNADEEEKIAKIISKSGCDILFVAIPSPKKEIFLNKYKTIIKIPFTMGVGGSFDVVAGKVQRSPLWMQKIGMEWFYRLLQEPRKMWKRYLTTNTFFIYYLFIEKIKTIFLK